MRCPRRILVMLAVAAVLGGAAGAAQDQKGGTIKKDENKKTDGKVEQPKVAQKLPALDEAALDERVLRDAKLGVDGPSLLKYLQDRTPTGIDPQRVLVLVRQLGDDKFAVRENAYRELLLLGQGALKEIREAERNGSEEVRQRAAELRVQIEESTTPLLQAAVARLIALRKPDGAVPILLGFLPFAASDIVVDDVCEALCCICRTEKTIDPAIVAALSDRLALRRGAAGEALVSSGVKEHQAAARKLLQDPDATVRLRVSRALVEKVRAVEAVPVLIACLKDLPAEKTWPAEDLLVRMAGTTAPQVSLGTDGPSQAKCHEEWERWWTAHRETIDLAKADFSHKVLGMTLVVVQNQPRPGQAFRGGSTISEVDVAKNTRWKLELPGNFTDAQVLGPDRVLLVERNSNRVAERDFQGEIKWEKALNGTLILSAQRLANGNTFLVTQTGLVECDAKGQEVYTLQRKAPDIARGRKMRNGDVVLVTTPGQVVRIDSKTNKQLKSFDIGILGSVYGTLEEMPSGNVLLPLYRSGRVVEYNWEGKEVWSVGARFPTSAMRLPNGNTVVGSLGEQRVFEFDRNQREVWSYQADGNVVSARKR
jgi:hypothetical protein